MANVLRIKRRSSAGATGAPSSLENAELAFNEADNILYYGKGTGGAGGTATTVEAIAGYGAYTTLSTSQTVTGDKTFSGVIIVPTPTANTHPTTKLYVDNAVANVTIANTAVTAGSYGSSSTVATFTVNAQGRLTAASNASISVTSTAVSDFTEAAQDAAAALFTSATHTGITATYDDANSKLTLSTTGVTSLAGTTDQIVASASTGSVTLSLPSNMTTPGNLVVTGDLTVQGNTTTLNTATLIVEDKNVVLANVSTPTNTTADGAGISVLGTTTKTFNWINATSAWTSSEHLDIASSKAYYINGTSVLNATTLGSGVTGSSLTSVGTIGTGVWQGTAVGVLYGGTGSTTASGARTALGLAIGTDVQAYSSFLANVAANTATYDGGTF